MLALPGNIPLFPKWVWIAMGGVANFGGVRGNHREFVDEFFRDHSTYWRDIYQADTLSARIYRERQAVVLGMIDRLEIPEGARVLDIGCGAGQTAVALAQREFMVTAADSVEDMLELTSQAAAEAGVIRSVKTCLADVCELMLPSDSFEIVVAMGVLPWVDRPEKAISEICRVLRSGGHLVLTVDNSWCLNQMLDPLCFPGLRPLRWRIGEMLEKLKLRHPSRPRLHRHSIKHIDGLLRRNGLQKLESKTLGFGPFTFLKQALFPDSISIRIHQKLQNLAESKVPGLRWLGTEYVVLARKN
jgi:ubiquinone/menaquinone biosynthesis C-methylase UbiE